MGVMSRSSRRCVAVVAAVMTMAQAPTPAVAQVLATRAGDIEAGSSYALRKSPLWYNRYIAQRAVYGAGYADFNRDGLVDAVVAPVDFGGGGAREPIRIMINNGDGSFTDQAGSLLSTPQPGVVHARETLVGDYNGDGWPDIFIAGHGYDQPPFPGEHLQLFLSNGDGTLRYDTQFDAQVGFNHGAASADVDGDGDMDILVAQQHHPHILVNDGAGHFTRDDARLPAELEWQNVFTCELADVDRDGHIDVILGGHEFENAPTTIYWGSTSGSFSAQSKSVLPADATRAIVLAYAIEDIDGDGDRDMVVSRTGQEPFYSGRFLQVLVQTAPRQFADESGARMSQDTSQGWIDYIRLQDVNGDGALDILHDEANEIYNSQYAWANDGHGVFAPYVGAVKPAPELWVADASVVEGQAGSKQLAFTVQASSPVIEPVTFDAATASGTAFPGSDYVEMTSLDQVIAPGESTAQVAVTVNGDTRVEGNESLALGVDNVVGARVVGARGRGRIVNDDLATLSVSDAARVEGDAGQSTLVFEVLLSQPMPTPVTFSVATANGSAVAGSDYVARAQAGRLLDAGRTRALFEVNLLGDATAEADETFTVALSNVSGAIAGDLSAVGTIVNDDGPTATAQPVASATATSGTTPVVATAVPAAPVAATDECRRLRERIARTEADAATGRLREASALRRILADERRGERIGCPR